MHKFERDEITKLTQRLLVRYRIGAVQIVPIHDEDGYMVAADFSSIS
jgi:hypothetical protein